MSAYGKTGVNANTPESIVFGAGTIHKNLKYSGSAWNFDASIIGATSGGSKITITPEIKKIEVDGALVPMKGLTLKTGETATMEINLIELTAEMMRLAAIGKAGNSEDSSFSLIESKGAIAEGDYLENIAFVGETADGKNIIVILDNALCTSGLPIEGKNKDSNVTALTFECHAELTGDGQTLPWHIYYPAN